MLPPPPPPVFGGQGDGDDRDSVEFPRVQSNIPTGMKGGEGGMRERERDEKYNEGLESHIWLGRSNS